MRAICLIFVSMFYFAGQVIWLEVEIFVNIQFFAFSNWNQNTSFSLCIIEMNTMTKDATNL